MSISAVVSEATWSTTPYLPDSCKGESARLKHPRESSPLFGLIDGRCPLLGARTSPADDAKVDSRHVFPRLGLVPDCLLDDCLRNAPAVARCGNMGADLNLDR